ncbi:MAG: hypothetical protein H8E79_05220 [Desulfobulbaceae bacterium]|uniref:Uncharacterized protein n=1 Tax=Candidatus Desulfatifera sulfidica TaxID=2841691 RepID=A0A8J6N833_9BACT|nr:hypothetical protein [Candidatus Desulfatifera sulfidica]
MNPLQLIPAADPLQVPWGWFQIFLTATFLFHLIAMNLMLGGTLINFFRHVRGQYPADLLEDTAHKIPFSVAFAVNFGVAPLLFLQVLHGQFIYTSSVLMASFWLLIMPLLIAAYGTSYFYSFNFRCLSNWHTVISGLIAILMLGVAFIFTCNLSLMLNPPAWTAYFERPEGLILNLSDPTLFPRFIHSVLGSIAVAGLGLALWHDWQARRGNSDSAQLIPADLRWFSGATMLNFAFGFWYFGSLPEGVRSASGFTGSLLIFFLLLGIATAILALIAAGTLRVRATAFWTLLTLTAMVLVRELVRSLLLNPWISTTEPAVTAFQYSPLFFFLLTLAGGLWLIWFIIRLVTSSTQADTKEARS